MAVVKSDEKKSIHFQKLATSKNSTIYSLSSQNLVKIEVIIFTEFYEDRANIVEFLQTENFGIYAFFSYQTLRNN